ncbi:acetyl-CoA carboxylase biotin carboxyl carrier protein subunit [Candidatus Nitrosotenuis cloacae]|uniref:acetyl-CoA carboxylase biotin carboxyl carrier protein subunit n=1 Tax=Candidatus Nitrosotenuis cloacae TaxID=1603555 RepID=UPI00227DBD06|nr:acetyl-CoA carboxylase biotin carboxyl carrier protein subunit [Candidatus Nitrosotenuis cloacae]
MEYKIEDITGTFDGQILKNLGNNDYVIKIGGQEHNLKILNMDSRGIEFILDQKYHKAKYLEVATAQMNLVIDGTPVKINMNSKFDEIVYKNSGGGGGADAQISLRSQIPGKVVSINVNEGDGVKKGDVVCVLESMKMQVSVKSHKEGVVKKIKIKGGGSVAKNDVLAEIE